MKRKTAKIKALGPETIPERVRHRVQDDTRFGVR